MNLKPPWPRPLSGSGRTGCRPAYRPARRTPTARSLRSAAPTDQYPPARAVDVVEPPYGYGQGRDEDRQGVDPAQQPRARIGAAGAKQGVDPPKHYAYDDVEEHEVPVLLASGPAAEDRVLTQGFEIPTQPRTSPSPRAACPFAKEHRSMPQ